MSLMPAGGSASPGTPSNDRASAVADASEHLRAALAILDASEVSKEAAAYIQTALDCMEQQER